jgi:hypothetical protein
LAAGLTFRTVVSLTGMLVSPPREVADTNEYTNNIAGYQQTGADAGEGYTPLNHQHWQNISNDSER